MNPQEMYECQSGDRAHKHCWLWKGNDRERTVDLQRKSDLRRWGSTSKVESNSKKTVLTVEDTKA